MTSRLVLIRPNLKLNKLTSSHFFQKLRQIGLLFLTRLMSFYRKALIRLRGHPIRRRNTTHDAAAHV